MGLTVNGSKTSGSAPCEIWQWQSQAAPKSVGGKVAQSKGQPSTPPPLCCCVRANNAALGSNGALHLHAAAHWRSRAGLPCGLLARNARLAKKARSAHPGERRAREALLRRRRGRRGAPAARAAFLKAAGLVDVTVAGGLEDVLQRNDAVEAIVEVLFAAKQRRRSPAFLARVGFEDIDPMFAKAWPALRPDVSFDLVPLNRETKITARRGESAAAPRDGRAPSSRISTPRPTARPRPRPRSFACAAPTTRCRRASARCGSNSRSTCRSASSAPRARRAWRSSRAARTLVFKLHDRSVP